MKVAILGFGTVGRGAYDAANRTLGAIEVAKVFCRHSIDCAEAVRTSCIEDIISDRSIELVIEAMGGIEPAHSYAMRVIRSGKHFVSANKQLISASLCELANAAEENGVSLRFTASAGGGIPWFVNLRRTMRADTIEAICGIVNGTTNYILDAMSAKGDDYLTALRQAQQLGYAEADPSADVSGLDTARKCVISASLAFDALIYESEVPSEGIGPWTEDVMRAAAQEPSLRGRVMRLMMHAGQAENGIYAYVCPVLVSPDSFEAEVWGCNNLLSFRAKHTGVQRFYGQGAGMEPTGTSVIQDALDIASGDGGFYVPAVSERMRIDNASVIRRFFVCEAGRTRTVQCAVSEMFLHAAAARASHETVYFAEIKGE